MLTLSSFTKHRSKPHTINLVGIMVRTGKCMLRQLCSQRKDASLPTTSVNALLPFNVYLLHTGRLSQTCCRLLPTDFYECVRLKNFEVAERYLHQVCSTVLSIAIAHCDTGFGF